MKRKRKQPQPRSHLGEAISSARNAAGLTQLELGHKLGFTGSEAGSHISRIEAGRTRPRVDTLGRIADALGVGVEKLIKGQ